MKYIFTLALFSILLHSCISDEPDAIRTNPLITNALHLEVVNDNVPADNYSYAQVRLIVKGNAVDTPVTFTIDKGEFANNAKTYNVTVSSQDTVKAYIKFNKADIVKVTATAFNDTKEVYVTFKPAYPSLIIVNPDVTMLPPLLASQSTITSNLIRINGKVTQGMVVYYHDSIATPAGGSIGAFFNSTYSDADGNATVKYGLQTTTYQGFVYLKAVVENESGVVIAKGENRIVIQ